MISLFIETSIWFKAQLVFMALFCCLLEEKYPLKVYFCFSIYRGSLQSVCEVLRSLWRCSRSERLYLITEDTEGNKSCLSWSRALHISCWKCLKCKHSGQRDLPHCCSAVTQLSSTPFPCCGNPFIFTITSDLGADGRWRTSCIMQDSSFLGSKVVGNVFWENLNL